MRATIAALGMLSTERVTETLSEQTIDALLDAFRQYR
jgi:hypothetical protein